MDAKQNFQTSYHRNAVSGSKGTLKTNHAPPTSSKEKNGKKPAKKTDADSPVQDESELKKISLPSDGVFRAVASRVAKNHWRSKRIEKFDLVIHTYACLQLGERHKYVVEEYVLNRLQAKARAWRSEILQDAAGTARSNQKNNGIRLTRDMLEQMAEEVISDVEAHVICLAKSGSPIKRGVREGNSVVRASLGLGRMNTCFLILEGSAKDPNFMIIALKTSAEFGRSVKKRLRDKRQRSYSNRPSMSRCM